MSITGSRGRSSKRPNRSRGGDGGPDEKKDDAPSSFCAAFACLEVVRVIESATGNWPKDWQSAKQAGPIPFCLRLLRLMTAHGISSEEMLQYLVCWNYHGLGCVPSPLPVAPPAQQQPSAPPFGGREGWNGSRSARLRFLS